MTDTKQLYARYWERFCRLLNERGSLVDLEPKPRRYISHPFGAGIRLSAVASKKESYISVELILEGDRAGKAKKQFAALQEQWTTIAHELTEPAVVCRNPSDVQQSDIKLRRNSYDISDESRWGEQHNWLYAKLQLFHAVFAHRVKEL